MKRLMIVVVAIVASMTVAVAQSSPEGVPFNAELQQLDSYLKLKSSQKKKVEAINNNFIQEQKTVKAASAPSEQKMQQLVAENLAGMKEVLSKLQFEKYVALLGTTNKNKNVLSEHLFADLIEQVKEK